MHINSYKIIEDFDIILSNVQKFKVSISIFVIFDISYQSFHFVNSKGFLSQSSFVQRVNLLFIRIILVLIPLSLDVHPFMIIVESLRSKHYFYRIIPAVLLYPGRLYYIYFVIHIMSDAAQECEAQHHAEQWLKIDSIAVFLDKFVHLCRVK